MPSEHGARIVLYPLCMGVLSYLAADDFGPKEAGSVIAFCAIVMWAECIYWDRTVVLEQGRTRRLGRVRFETAALVLSATLVIALGMQRQPSELRIDRGERETRQEFIERAAAAIARANA